jgi:VIT1/CCC1 family predicted Fe2+/Mn2+ transporter
MQAYNRLSRNIRKEFKMSIEYDPTIIDQLAERLYGKANTATVLYTIIGALLGAALVILLTGQLNLGIIIDMLIVGIFGYLYGKEKAFAFKLQAQMALCQAEIEANLGLLLDKMDFKEDVHKGIS